jgi:hypothetical protein
MDREYPLLENIKLDGTQSKINSLIDRQQQEDKVKKIVESLADKLIAWILQL